MIPVCKGLRFWLGSLLLLGLAVGCHSRPQVLYLTSFDELPAERVQIVREAVQKFYGRPVHLLPTQHHTAATICRVRHRHRAAAVLEHLQLLLPDSTTGKILALTTKDVEIEDGTRRPHWGVMGLANHAGGNACVVSSFRLGGRTDRLRKVSLHEVGHLLSLPHCQSGTATCFMQDARGRAATVDRAREQLCRECRARLAW
ncbi:hypothetical protein [Hymenobacter cellulosivorans]|uniref:Matrixin family metalloprotease n=1 Tax=Hymenobacter cellulosivorans TaxID=2932249 RepID=A0ABY4F416_9BACT|nr:hypothetical protein [Hymenobacter cellulosivorans]UOQ50971.1 hypothetical protein MUN80_14515 [Hymenobacter cellulosivorans]